MNVSAKAEEILESLWIATEEKSEDAAHFERLGIAQEDEGLAELVRLAFVEVNGEWVRLRKEGREEARMTVRRHRLAERLMMDILDIKGVTGDERACEFEHLLHHGVDTKIYANGILIVDWAKTIDTTDVNPFQIGLYGWPGNYFDGLIDEVRVYNRAVSAGEALSLAGGTAPIDQPY